MPYDVAEQLLMYYTVILVSSLIAILVTAFGFWALGWRYVYLGTAVALYILLGG